MNNLFKIEKVCGFYVSNMHFVTMIFPYLREKMKEGASFYTFFENDLESDINKVISGIIGDSIDKKEILKINWKNNSDLKDSTIKKKIDMESKSEKIILVSGSKQYIDLVNKILENVLQRNNINCNNIKIINCYELEVPNESINEILEKYDKIINTSGEHEKEEILNNYHGKKVV